MPVRGLVLKPTWLPDLQQVLGVDNLLLFSIKNCQELNKYFVKIIRNIDIKLSKNAREGMYTAIRTKKMFVNLLDLLI